MGTRKENLNFDILRIRGLIWLFFSVSLCSMLLDKKFKSELVRMNAEAAGKLGTRSNRYETLLKQRHVQVQYVQAKLQSHICFTLSSKALLCDKVFQEVTTVCI